MTARFCTQCGAPMLPEARYCAACGQAAGVAQAPRRLPHGLPLERWAPAIVLATIVLVAGAAIVSGIYTAPPPNVPPPRSAGGPRAGGELPQNHPPVEIPADVRNVIAKLADAAKADPDNVPAWQQLGFVQYRAGQVDPAYLTDADATYAHILEREPENLDALRARGNIAYDRNDPARALELYRSYLRLKPDDLGVQTDLGTMLLTMQQVDAALQAYRDVLAADPGFFQAQFNLAIAYRAAGDEEQALAAMRRAREIAGDDATRQRVDALLAHLEAPGGTAGAAPPVGDLRQDVEAIFRGHPIAAAKIDRIDWAAPDRVRVVLREFPMDGMPAAIRERFIDRIRTGLRESAARHAPAPPPRVELVDAATGAIMETITVSDAGAPASGAAAPAAAGASTALHDTVETLFRTHPIAGPKLDRVEWPDDVHARVLLREFPMEAMPPMIRERFTTRIRDGLRDGKSRAQTPGPVTIELVDADSGRVMERITD